MSQLPSKLHLHDRLKKHAYEHALITTYNFSAQFFENYALENFKSLQDNGNISILLDDGEYQDLLRSAVENPDSFPKLANIRYLLHPIRVPGVFHPKIFLFASKKRGLLLIGSANFTQDGLGSNAELVAAFDYEEEKNETALPLFQSALHFFEALADRWPSEQLRSNLNTLLDQVPWMSQPAPENPDPDLPVLLSNLETPLWDQLMARLPTPAAHLSVLSRFYDARPALVDHVFQTTTARGLTLYTQNGITTLTKAWLEVPAFGNGTLDIRLCYYKDGDHFQHLHGKAYAFACGREIMLAMGSANFTESALRRIAAKGNLEVLLCYPPVSSREFNPKSWFDPHESAVVLREAAQLQTAPDNTDETAAPCASFPVRIAEAFVEEQWLKLKIAHGQVPNGLSCQIAQGNHRPFDLKVEPMGANELRCHLDESEQKHLRSNPAMVVLGVQVAGKWTPQSQPVLVTNLQDLVTGRDSRRERQIREARESPQRFMDVLTVLANGDDEERLKQFLTYCDIPLDLEVRPFRRRSFNPAPGATGVGDFHISAGRNLRHFEVLHEAVMDFVHRHQYRLDQHVKQGRAKGIGNYLHILLTTGNLLLSQIGRIVAALECEPKLELKRDHWAQIRDRLDAYYHALDQLLETTAVRYLDALLNSESPTAISAEFAESLPGLHTLLERVLRNRDQMLALQQTRLVVVTPTGQTIPGPGFFNSLLSPEKWPDFARHLQYLEARFKSRLTS